MMLKFNEYNSLKQHNYYLPSYEEAKKMCAQHDNLLFYETHHELEGYNVSIFNYRLAQWSDFENPLKNDSGVKAYEMRGLTFLFNKDGSLYKRFLLLDKFFNLEQTPCSAYSIVKDFKIKRVFNKEDGSIASFIQLPNGSVYGKSKTSFQSEQAIEIQKIYQMDTNIKRCVDYFLKNDIVAVFEYVSPQNRIVVPYANTELILLQLRNNSTGEYINIDEHSHILNGVSVAATEELDLDELIELVKIEKDKEGWVVQFENGKMVKIKTEWYFNLHKLFTDELNRDNTLLGMILNDTIDDAISQLGKDETSKKTKADIEHVIDVVNFKIGSMSKQVDELLKSYTGDVKEFAIKYNKHPLFPFAIGVINGKDKIEMIREHLKKITKNLLSARKWLEKSKLEFNS